MTPVLRSACCAAAAAALLAGCGGAPDRPAPTPALPGAASEIPTTSASASRAPGRSPRGLPDLDRVDRRDATAVSKAALTVMHTVDAAVDEGLQDARLRASRFFTADFADRVRAEPAQYVPREWREHRAYAKVRLKRLEPEAGAPSDSPTEAFRQWEVTATPHGRDDWRGAPRTSVVFVQLVRPKAGASWRISAVLAPGGG